MATIYDYVVHFRVTRRDGQVEEWRHPVQAYNASEAVYTAGFEIDAEHTIVNDEMRVLSVRPDTTKLDAETQRLLAQAVAEFKHLRKKP